MTDLDEARKLKLAGIVNHIAASIIEGQSLATLAAHYSVDVDTMQELAGSAAVEAELNRVKFAQTHRMAKLARGWSGLEEDCCEGLGVMVEGGALTPSELVQVTRVAIEAQKERTTKPAQLIQQQTHVSLNFSSPVQPQGNRVHLDPTKVESVLPQGEVQKLFAEVEPEVAQP